MANHVINPSSSKILCLCTGAHGNFSREGQMLGVMANANGGLWRSLQRGVQGQSPWSGGQEANVPEAESFEAFVRLNEGPKLCCQYAKAVWIWVWAADQGDCLSFFPAFRGANAPTLPMPMDANAPIRHWL